MTNSDTQFVIYALIIGVFMFSSCSNQYQAIGVSENKEPIEIGVNNLNLSDYLRRIPQLVVTGSENDVKVNLRENSSISASSEPLYVLDEVKMGRDYHRVSRIIDPNDIKSVRALTNASDTAIYGLDGSSGVILITTKK